jgi:hypothetical protein
MSKQNDNKQDNENGFRPKLDKKSPPPFASKGLLAWFFILGIICLLIFFREPPSNGAQEISYNEFVSLVDNNRLAGGGEIIYNPQAPELKEVIGKYLVDKNADSSSASTSASTPMPFVIKTTLSDDLREKLLRPASK